MGASLPTSPAPSLTHGRCPGAHRRGWGHGGGRRAVPAAIPRRRRATGGHLGCARARRCGRAVCLPVSSQSKPAGAPARVREGESGRAAGAGLLPGGQVVRTSSGAVRRWGAPDMAYAGRPPYMGPSTFFGTSGGPRPRTLTQRRSSKLCCKRFTVEFSAQRMDARGS